MWPFNTAPATTPVEQKLLDQLETLSAQVAELKGERKANRELISLTDQVTKLKEEISSLEIGKSKLEEKNAREKREIEHMVGLEKKRQETELKLGMREAKLEVSEQNLAADKARFDENVAFIKDETASTRKLVTELLERLPKVTIDGTLTTKEK